MLWHSSSIVYVRVHVQPQSDVWVALSVWLTVKLPQSLNRALISSSSFRPMVSAFAKQLFWFSMSEGHVPAVVRAGLVWSLPLTL